MLDTHARPGAVLALVLLVTTALFAPDVSARDKTTHVKRHPDKKVPQLDAMRAPAAAQKSLQQQPLPEAKSQAPPPQQTAPKGVGPSMRGNAPIKGTKGIQGAAEKKIKKLAPSSAQSVAPMRTPTSGPAALPGPKVQRLEPSPGLPHNLGAARELVAADVRLVEMVRTGREVTITGRANRAIPLGVCCDLVLSEGPLGERILWRGRATVVRLGSGYGFVAMADHTIPVGKRQQLVAQLHFADSDATNNRLAKWVGPEGAAEFTERDRITARAVGGPPREAGLYEIRQIAIRRTGSDWAEADVTVYMPHSGQVTLRVDTEGIPGGSCTNGLGESEFLVSEYIDSAEFNETFHVICRASPSRTASGQIRATLLGAQPPARGGVNPRGVAPRAQRSVPWSVRATESTIDRIADRREARLREIAGTDAAPADLSVGVDFVPQDSRPHYVRVSVRNHGGSTSPPVQLDIRFQFRVGSTSGHVLRTVPALEPNESWSELVVIGPLAGLRWEEIAAGDEASIVSALVDSAGALFESNESDNEASTETRSSGMHWRLRHERP